MIRSTTIFRSRKEIFFKREEQMREVLYTSFFTQRQSRELKISAHDPTTTILFLANGKQTQRITLSS